MASPLAVIRTIVRDKNTSAMPFATSLATFLNASTWTGYGLLVAQDPMIWSPNLLGLAAASVQMGLFLKYPSTPAPGAPVAGDGEAQDKGEEGAEGAQSGKTEGSSKQ